MKKLLAFAVALMLTVTMGMTLSACGSGSESGDGGGVLSSKPDVDLSQIDWTVESGIIDGYRTVVFGYTNNTDYEIVDFDLEFKVKDEVTDEQLEANSEIKEKAADMEHPINETTMEAITHKVVPAGESVSGCACTLDGTIEYYSDFDSYELFEPDMMTVVVASGDKLYAAYYDFASGNTTMDEDVADAYTWASGELGNAVPQPDVPYLTTNDYDDSFYAYAYGVSKDMFKAYVEQCKSKGFDQNVDEDDDSFSADNGEGISIDVDYGSMDDEMAINADKE